MCADYGWSKLGQNDVCPASEPVVHWCDMLTVSALSSRVAAAVTGGLQDAPYPGGNPTVQDLCAAAEAARGPGDGAKNPQLPGDVLHRGKEVRAILASRGRASILVWHTKA